jgi:hypothetical protein
MSENWLPNIVPSVNNFTKAWNKLLDWCRRNTLQSSDDILVTQTTHGTTLKIRKRIAYGGSGGAPQTPVIPSLYRGIWTASPPSPYMFGNQVSYGTGANANTYMSTIDGNTTVPTSGIGWVSMNGFNVWV